MSHCNQSGQYWVEAREVKTHFVIEANQVELPSMLSMNAKSRENLIL